MTPLTCAKCRGKFSPHFQRCPHCNQPNPNATSPQPLPTTSTPADNARPVGGIGGFNAQAAQREASMDLQKLTAMLACPCCGGAPGTGVIQVETREFKGTNFFPARRKYLMRSSEIQKVCAGCLRQLEKRRYLADVVCMLPFIASAILLCATDEKIFFVLMLLYFLFLFKWTWGLGYTWADGLLYGLDFQVRLAQFTPPGDPGTVRYPASFWHCLVRLGWIPALILGLGLIANIFTLSKKQGAKVLNGSATTPENPATAPAPEPDIRGNSPEAIAQRKAKSERELAAARTFLKDAQQIMVPVDSVTRLPKKENVARTDMDFYTVYAAPALPPKGPFLIATGPQLLALFIKTKGHDVDLLFINGPNLPLSRWQVERLAAEMPATVPTGPVQENK